MELITQHRYTAIPTTWVNNSINYISVSTDIMEVYVVDNSGAVKRIFNEADVNLLIDTAIAASGGVKEVVTIAERDALNPTSVVQVYVADAHLDDATVTSGGAFYLYRPSTSSWKKTGEDESLDLVIDWATLQNKPLSSVAAIDGAVAASHTHANATELGKITEDAAGNVLYGGNLVAPHWTTVEW